MQNSSSVLFIFNPDSILSSNKEQIVRIFASFLAVVILLAGCATTATVTEKHDLEEKEFELELSPYESIGFYMSVGDPLGALELFEAAYSENPDSAETKILHSSLLLTVGQLDEARSALNEVLSEDPGNLNALFNMSFLEGMAGNTVAQKKQLNLILDVDSENAEALSYLGEIFLTEKKYDKAEDVFKKSIDFDEDNIVARVGYGNLLLRDKSYEESALQFDHVVETNPDYSFAYTDRSKARAGLNDASGAIADLTKAIELNGEYYWNYVDRGKLLIFVNDNESAFDDFNRAIEIDPDFFYAYVYRAGINQGKNNIDAAVSDYNKVIQLRPDYYYAYEPLSIMEYMNGNYARASELFEKTSENFPEDPAYILLTGISKYADGDKEGGIDIFKTAMNDLSSESYFYDIARMFSEPGYDSYLVSKLTRETQKPLKARVLFYVATYYKLQGNLRLANTYFFEVADAKIYGMFETDLAEYELRQSGILDF
jgi:tetratricopeptide (TPR) repeat protein